MSNQLKTHPCILAIDPGHTFSGLVEIRHGVIHRAWDADNEAVLDFLVCWCLQTGEDGIVLYEDVMLYGAKAGKDVIRTIKFIGVLERELAFRAHNYKAVFRWEVKKWVYDTWPDLCKPRVDKKIGLIKKREPGKNPNNTFILVDDRIVIAAMKLMWGIETPKPGQRTLHGLSVHSWQALAVASLFIAGKTEPL